QGLLTVPAGQGRACCLTQRLDGRCNASTVGRVGLCAVVDVTVLHVFRYTCDGACRVIEQGLLLLVVHQAEQIARLREVVGVFAVVPVVCCAFDRQRRFAELGLFLPFTLRIGFVARDASVVAIDTHGAIAVIAMVGALWGIDRNLVVVDTQAVALGV